ncbi:helix-turn-helix domain-containing protein [Kutzneria sp. CA-103260]|uniref:helix-turn-helix domain-containing protein n=1 Tax=Kutzneria sp. CA-103260 TaxID=2802641 RepID=UPI001BAA84A0|nr:helix-turn-helix domain-containing protein [Kutzneria sp. CA-103260]
MDTYAFGRILRAYRREGGFTQQQLADRAMLSVRAVRDLELGNARQPRVGTVRLLADGLQLRGQRRSTFEAAAGRFGETEPALHGRSIGREENQRPPAPLHGLVGRRTEVRALTDLLVAGDQRLVTVTGVGGVGKSRLAAEVATTVHTEFGWPVLWPTEPAAEFTVADQPTLLVLDGEWRGQPVTTLLHRFPALRVVITSRTPSGIPGERVFPLGPLDQAASERLLLTHIRLLRPAFEPTPAVTEVCQLVDGLPGALEQAARRFLLLPASRLIVLLARDPHILAPIRDSIDGLRPSERFLLGRLADRDASWAVDETGPITAELVHTLLSHGLLHLAEHGGEPRFRVLTPVRLVLSGRNRVLPGDHQR